MNRLDSENEPPPNINPAAKKRRRRSRSTEDLVRDLRGGDRIALSRAITLVESTRPDHREQAQEIIDRCLPHAGDSIRVGVTGVPGVGKSTFIEALGTRLTEVGRRLAVLATDPTSERSRGSILGDKTRMERLAADENAFIRPSPTAGTLGGVARKTRETIFLCEAAGYETIFVETVGVGQAEITVHSMVDFFLLLALTGAGDELQGIKRGIVEMADAIAITKADGDNKEKAENTRMAYERALQLFPPTESGWQPVVHTCSALTGDGIEAVWETIESYEKRARETGFFDQRRQEQARHWMHQTIEHRLREEFLSNKAVQEVLSEIEAQVIDGTLSSFAAAEKLLSLYRQRADAFGESPTELDGGEAGERD